jgi:cysteine desulfurase
VQVLESKDYGFPIFLSIHMVDSTPKTGGGGCDNIPNDPYFDMHANNEVGTIHRFRSLRGSPKDITSSCTRMRPSVGKIPVYVDEMGVDLLSMRVIYFMAPKVRGDFYSQGAILRKLIHGAIHERNFGRNRKRYEIVGLGRPCEIAVMDLSMIIEHMKKLRNLLYGGLKNPIGIFG